MGTYTYSWAHFHVCTLSLSRSLSLSLPLCLSLPPHLFFSSCVAIFPSLTVHFLHEWGWANGVLGKAVRQLQAYTISTSDLRGYKECIHVENSMQKFSLTWFESQTHPWANHHNLNPNPNPNQGDGVLWLIRSRSHAHLYATSMPLWLVQWSPQPESNKMV